MAHPPLRPQKTAMLVAQQIVADIHRRGNRWVTDSPRSG